MTDEVEMRTRIVAEAMSWVGTPYVSNAMVKGKIGGGTDCAMFLVAVYTNLGLIPNFIDPRPYSPQWHLHKTQELYMGHVLKYAYEVPGPPERMPKLGDVVMFRMGQVHAHGAIVIGWPNVIHAVGNSTVRPEDISKNTLGKRALALVPKRFFSLWKE